MTASSSRLGRWVSVFAAAWLVAALAISPFLAGAGQGVDDSVAAYTPEGRRALALLFEELGWRTVPWRAPPAGLAASVDEESLRGPLLWWAQVPDPGFSAPSSEGDTGAGAGGARELGHYREFVERGGCLVLALSEERLEVVGDLFGAELIDGLELNERPELLDVFPIPSGGAQPASDPQPLVLDWRGFELAGPAVGAGQSWEPFWRAANGACLGAACAVGDGFVIALGDDTFVRNLHVGEDDHALAAVRLAERFAGERVLYFDEYAVGRWRPRSVVARVLSGRLAWPLAHVTLLLLVLAWRLAWPREFPRDPDPVETVSPRSRAQARAVLLTRARQFDLLADMLRHGALRAAAQRWHRALGRGTPAEQLEELAAGIGAAGALPLWRELFVERKVANAAELEELAGELSDWESICAPGKLHPPGVSRRATALGGALQ